MLINCRLANFIILFLTIFYFTAARRMKKCYKIFPQDSNYISHLYTIYWNAGIEFQEFFFPSLWFLDTLIVFRNSVNIDVYFIPGVVQIKYYPPVFHFFSSYYDCNLLSQKRFVYWWRFDINIKSFFCPEWALFVKYFYY